MVIKEGLSHLNFVSRANQECVCEREETPVVNYSTFSENVDVHAQLHCHQIIEHLVILFSNCFIQLFIVFLVKLLCLFCDK